MGRNGLGDREECWENESCLISDTHVCNEQLSIPALFPFLMGEVVGCRIGEGNKSDTLHYLTVNPWIVRELNGDLAVCNACHAPEEGPGRGLLSNQIRFVISILHTPYSSVNHVFSS